MSLFRIIARTPIGIPLNKITPTILLCQIHSYILVIITHLASQTYIWYSCKWNFVGQQIYFLKSKAIILRICSNICFGIESFVDED